MAMKFDKTDAATKIEKYLLDGVEARRALAAQGSDKIIEAALIIAKSMEHGGKLLLCGNGGSAADCQHMAAEFTCQLTKDFVRPALPAIALTTDTSFLTAYSNDIGFGGVFRRQVEALGKSGDVLLGISTSGSSANVLEAFQEAKKRQLSTIALIGAGGKLGEIADLAIAVPAKNNQVVQECHLAIEHLICHFVERALFPH